MNKINLIDEKELKIMFRELIRNFLLTAPLDIFAFLIITISVGIPLFLTTTESDFYFISLLFFSLLVACYLLYSFLMKPMILGQRYSDWCYYEESGHDPTERTLKQLGNRIKFLESADKYLLMKQGELNSKLWGEASYVDALKKLIARGINIEIVKGANCDVESKEILKLAIEEKIKIYNVSNDVIDKIWEGHFIITNRRGAWISEVKPPFSRDRKGRYSLGPTRIADEVKKKFEELKSQGNIINKETITDMKFLKHNFEEEPVDASDVDIECLFKYLKIDNKVKT